MHLVYPSWLFYSEELKIEIFWANWHLGDQYTESKKFSITFEVVMLHTTADH